MLTDKPAPTVRKAVALPARRLIRPLTLRLIAAVVALMLVLLFPAHHLLMLENSDSMPSRISILYSQALLNANPGNVELRISLANKLFQVGEFALAKATLEPLHDSRDITVQWLRLSIEMAVVGCHCL